MPISGDVRAAPVVTMAAGPASQQGLRSGRPVEVQSLGCGSLAEVDPQGLAVTYWFDAPPEGEPSSFTLHIAGRLRAAPPTDGQGTFTRLVNINGIVPGSGSVAVTTRVFGLPRGTWDVTVTPVQPILGAAEAAWEQIADSRLSSGTASGNTVFGPAARVIAPGVRLGAWPALVSAGAVLGLLVQGLLASHLGLPVQRVLPLSIVASVLGVFGAKTYFLVTHRQQGRFLAPGMSVQGFVLVAVAVLLGGSWILALPPGRVLDATAAGLLLGMMVGRFGCLLGGCCAGRPTRSRWGVWSSDRYMGVRRVPVQLLESVLAGAASAFAVLAVLGLPASAGGLVFAATVAAYIAGRQVLFPLRNIPRTTSYGRLIVLVSSALVALAATTALVLP